MFSCIQEADLTLKESSVSEGMEILNPHVFSLRCACTGTGTYPQAHTAQLTFSHCITVQGYGRSPSIRRK